MMSEMSICRSGYRFLLVSETTQYFLFRDPAVNAYGSFEAPRPIAFCCSCERMNSIDKLLHCFVVAHRHLNVLLHHPG